MDKKSFIKNIENLKLKGKIAIFGGAFNPFHRGHFEIAKYIYRELGIDNLYFLPTYVPSHKKNIDLLPYSLRMDMINRVLLKEANDYPFSILDIERFLPQPNYSFNLLNYLKKFAYSSTTFYFVMGADSFLNFDTWYEYEKYKNLAHLVVVCRSSCPQTKLLQQKDKLEKKGISVKFLNMPLVDISSTEIRKFSYEAGKYFLNKTFFQKSGLKTEVSNKSEAFYLEKLSSLLPSSLTSYWYQTAIFFLWQNFANEQIKDNYLEIDNLLLNHLSFERTAHSWRVALLGLYLAPLLGVNSYHIYRAGLLHDIKKNCNYKEDSYLCFEWKEEEKFNTNLWHGPVGAGYLLKNRIEINPLILESIRVHTTLKANYSPLDALLYVVDKVELGRDYEDLSEIRLALGVNIDKAVYLCSQAIANVLNKRGLNKEARELNVVINEAKTKFTKII